MGAWHNADGTLDSNKAIVILTVNAVAAPPANTAPVAKNDSYTTAEDTPLTITLPGVLANDADAEGNALLIETSLQNTHADAVGAQSSAALRDLLKSLDADEAPNTFRLQTMGGGEGDGPAPADGHVSRLYACISCFIRYFCCCCLKRTLNNS